MGKIKTWNVKVDGIDNEVIFSTKKGRKLFVNGKEIELEKGFYQTYIGLDQKIEISGKECRFVLIGDKPDLAVDGVYLDSGKPYVPLKSMPWWVWIFIALCAAVPLVSLGGALPILIAVLGTICCVRISITPNIATPIKVLCCLGIAVLAWILLGVLVLVLAVSMVTL